MKKIELELEIKCLEADLAVWRQAQNSASKRAAFFSGHVNDLVYERRSLKLKLSDEQAEVIRLRGLLAAEIELRKELSEELLRRSALGFVSSPFTGQEASCYIVESGLRLDRLSADSLVALAETFSTRREA